MVFICGKLDEKSNRRLCGSWTNGSMINVMEASTRLTGINQSIAQNDLLCSCWRESEVSMEVYENCLTHALTEMLDRNSLIIALGGGAIGDLAGFVASTYMRGIRFIQMPTTILAHDSAIGGKVAINHPLGKNMIGQFHQPEAVFFDVKFFSTLPENEVRSGFAELSKTALLSQTPFYKEFIM